jgi:phytoene desaturase
MKIGIVGAGIAGLASAVRMASRGHEVHVFEANSYAGGKLSEFSLFKKEENSPKNAQNTVEERNSDTFGKGAYRFDAGPSLFTMPQYVEDLFKVANVDIKGRFEYLKSDVVCQYFWDDNTRLTAYFDQDKFAQEVEKQLNVKQDVVKKALAKAEKKYTEVGQIFLEKSLHKPKTWFNSKIAKAMFLMPTYDIFKTMNRTHEQLLGHPKLVQYFNRFATYNGSNPYKASGMLSVIPHFEHGIGCFYPIGGMYEITRSIYNLALEKGVIFHFNSPVEEIITNEKQVKGLKIKELNSIFYCDKVISNMDIYFTYKKLLPKEKHPNYILNQERSTSALIFYWGIKHDFKELHLHNIFFSKDYKNEFDYLAKNTVSDDPTVYVNISSKLTPTDAPEGCENWFVMVNVPHNSGQDWDALIQTTRVNVLRKLSLILKQNISKLIEAEETLTPLSIESKTQSFGGALYGTSSNSLMSAFLRHKNFSTDINGLYFCGGSVHPGGGIPLCLLSAKIVEEVMFGT